MELTPDDIDILDRFFRNELTGEESTMLQSRMKDADFAEAAKLHLLALAVVGDAGRDELRAELTSIQAAIQKSDGFDNYKPSLKGKGSGGKGFFTSIIIIIIGFAAYLFFSGKMNTEYLHHVFPNEGSVDTVYHYSTHIDTFVVSESDTIKRETIRKKTSDTIFILNHVSDTISVDSF